MKNKIILVVIFILFASITGCSRKPVSSPTPAETGSSGSQADVFQTGGMPAGENYFVISGIVSFEDGTQPKPYKGEGAQPDMYEFGNLRLVVTLKGKTTLFPAIVRKEGYDFHLGTTVIVAGNVKDYGKVDRIIFRAAGYRDVEFTDSPISNKFVNLPEVVMKK